MKRLGVRAVRFEAAVHELAAIIEKAENPVTVETAFLRHAQRMVPACRIELIAGAVPSDAHLALVDGAGVGSVGRERAPRPGDGRRDDSLREVPVRCGSAERGRLRVRPRTRGVASLRKETIQRLTTLCTLAACALDRLGRHEEWPGDDKPGHVGDWDGVDSAPGADQAKASFVNTTLLDATILNAVLPFALNQARRHNEPLSLVCVAIDRLGGIQELLGRVAVDHLVRTVGETVASLIRASDIVARLERRPRGRRVAPRMPGWGA